MDLLIDIGNTSLKWCLLDVDGLLVPKSLRRIGTWHTDLLNAWSELPTPGAVRIGSVAPTDVETQIVELTLALWNLVPMFERPRQHLHGLVLAYTNPLRLGVDRWLALVAVHKRGYGPVLVVDCGTAVTVDFLDAYSQHQGGLILPGLSLLWDSLFTGTGVTMAELPKSVGMLGRDTGECVAAGAIQAVVGLVERVHRQICRRGTIPRIVLTGGDATSIAEQLTLPYELVPELVLEGLALL